MKKNQCFGGDTNPTSPYVGLCRSYQDIKRRCYNKNYKNYNVWGGRGIRMCSEWESDYFAFRTWALQNGWAAGLTIDRIDCDKDYCPENCRWIKKQEQSLNLRNTNLYDCNGNIYSQRRLIEFLWTLEVGEIAHIRKLKCNTMKVGNPHHNNHRNGYSKSPNS